MGHRESKRETNTTYTKQRKLEIKEKYEEYRRVLNRETLKVRY